MSLPEVVKLLDLVRQAESCRTRCADLLKGPMALKVHFEYFDFFPVSFPGGQFASTSTPVNYNYRLLRFWFKKWINSLLLSQSYSF